MQLDAKFEKEQIGTLFVWVGLVLGPRGGGGVRPRIYTWRPLENFFPLLAIVLNCMPMSLSNGHTYTGCL